MNHNKLVRQNILNLFTIACSLCVLLNAGFLNAQEQEIDVTPDDLKMDKDYSPYAGKIYPDKVLFGG